MISNDAPYPKSSLNWKGKYFSPIFHCPTFVFRSFLRRLKVGKEKQAWWSLAWRNRRNWQRMRRARVWICKVSFCGKEMKRVLRCKARRIRQAPAPVSANRVWAVSKERNSGSHFGGRDARRGTLQGAPFKGHPPIDASFERKSFYRDIRRHIYVPLRKIPILWDSDRIELSGSCHKRQKPQAPTPQAPIRNRKTRKVANAKGLNRNTNLT